MKIDVQKQKAFLNKILNATNNRELHWTQQQPHSVSTQNVFAYYNVDAEGVFSCQFSNKLHGQLWIAMCSDEKIHGAIGQNTNQMEYFDIDNEEVSILLTRLFYLLLDNTIYANKLIDDYLDDKPDN